MAEYIRKYPEAPTEEEIRTGYAPSTVRAAPFYKFLFWTFAGLGISYLISYGAYLALDKVQEMEDARYQRMSAREPEPFTGPRLQPSPGHERLDFEDQAELDEVYREQLKSKKLWQDEPQNLNAGRPAISDEAVSRARAQLRSWGK